MKRMHVYIKGIVQGVSFRAETQRAAVDLNLTGWVRNTQDRRVEAVFEGEEANVEKIMDWCKIGPLGALVVNITTVDEPYTGSYSDFKIKYY